MTWSSLTPSQRGFLTFAAFCIAGVVVAQLARRAGWVGDVLGLTVAAVLTTSSWATIAPAVADARTLASSIMGRDATATVGSCDEHGPILATIRHLESGGDYQVLRSDGRSSAAGAYQFTLDTWLGLGGDRYAPTANMASPGEQDTIAVGHVARILAANRGDVRAIPRVWYVGAGYAGSLDAVPSPEAGNTLTVNQYVDRWMAIYERNVAACALAPTGEYALPLPDGSFSWADMLSTHHDYPAIDVSAATGTPILSMTAGTVVRTTNEPTNCYERTCVSKCGLGATVVDPRGVRWSYCHMHARAVELGAAVAAGTPLGTVGNTGNSSGPHLHLGVCPLAGCDDQTPNTWACPQPLLEAIHLSTPIPDPVSLPRSGCTH